MGRVSFCLTRARARSLDHAFWRMAKTPEVRDRLVGVAEDAMLVPTTPWVDEPLHGTRHHEAA
eukprot:2239125-Alexandrium_andersonii.AAC.1